MGCGVAQESTNSVFKRSKTINDEQKKAQTDRKPFEKLKIDFRINF